MAKVLYLITRLGNVISIKNKWGRPSYDENEIIATIIALVIHL